MLNNVLDTVRRYFDLCSKRRLYTEIKNVLNQIPADFGGGCSMSKAYLMADSIRRYDLQVTVDIGVYRGRSLFPQAIAHRLFTGGVVYGIDPWSAEEAKECDNPALCQKIDQWVKEIDFEILYEEVEASIDKYQLQDHCVLLRCTSADAISTLRDKEVYFDMIHMDGNHDTKIVMKDVQPYVPLLKKDGFVVLDDSSWESVKPAYQQLKSTMSLVYESKEPMKDYAIFWNGTSRLGTVTRRLVSLWLGSK